MPTRLGTLPLIHELLILLRHTIFCVFEVVVIAILWFLNLQKLPICFINENHFYSNNKVM